MPETQRLVFSFPPYRLDPSQRLLTRDEQPISLTPKEFDTLVVLVEAAGRVVDKEELISKVWPDSYVGDGSLARNISVLRKALGEDVIETHRGRGYRICLPISAIASGPVVAPFEPLKGQRGTNLDLAPGASSASGASTEPDRKAASNPWGMAVPVVIAMAALAGAYWYLSRPLRPPRITGYTQVTHDGRTKELRGADGSRLYFTQLSPNRIAQVSVNGGEIAEVPVAVPEKRWGVALKDVSRDGSNVLIGIIGGEEEKHATDSLWIAPILGGPAKRLDAGVSGSFGPDGSEVIYSTGEGDIFRSRIDGTEKRKLANVGFLAYWFRWSPNGKTIRFTRGDSSLWEMDSDGSALHQLLSDWTEKGRLCCGEWTSGRRFLSFPSIQV